MTSNPFYKCCNVFEPGQNNQTTISSDTRNIYHKNKNTNINNTPKSSLKTLNSAKSLKGFQLMKRSALSYQPSTINKTYKPPLKRQNQAPVKVVYVQPFDNIPQKKQNYLTPNTRQASTEIMTPRDKVKFSYSVQKSQTTNDKVMQSYLKNIRQQPVLNVENQIPVKEVINKAKFNIKQPLPTKLVNLPLEKNFSIISRQSQNSIQLGGSKYTIQSKDMVQQILDDKSLNIEQSTILVNVFHPTGSQIQKWALNTNKEQIIDYSNRGSKFQI